VGLVLRVEKLSTSVQSTASDAEARFAVSGTDASKSWSQTSWSAGLGAPSGCSLANACVTRENVRSTCRLCRHRHNRRTEAQTVAASTAGGIAVDWALAQVGTPYIWGGETPGVGFDCSGLVQAAYKVAGVTLPRTAQEQYDATAKLGPDDPLEPGDLVFFGSGPTDVTHVGIYVGNGEMVDAPYTGADVRVEPIPATPGSSWGSDVYLGATTVRS
jgi:cell wall-associated NlpC family hydrolase